MPFGNLWQGGNMTRCLAATNGWDEIDFKGEGGVIVIGHLSLVIWMGIQGAAFDPSRPGDLHRKNGLGGLGCLVPFHQKRQDRDFCFRTPQGGASSWLRYGFILLPSYYWQP